MNPLVTTGQDRRGAPTALSVNVNKIALLRNQRPLAIPSVVGLARIALEAGAHGITVHPRPDERHIRAGDVRELAALLQAWPEAELNIEGNPYQNLMPLLRELRPQQCTFVPDDAAQATSDHGWDLGREADRLAPMIAETHALGVRVSLFMDADATAMAKAQAIGADRIELYTEPYAQAWATPAQGAVLAAFRAAAQAAQRLGLGVNAGHDLNLANLGAFLAAVPGVLEVSIGHAFIADALELGMAEAVRAYRRVIETAAAS
ncbi:MAG TPA: pyridoxine 5'-phosphate synthase [Caldimonas sp.]|nr:pyridoxine 5'-phosphate synthase [Caldimonas sp.]HEV7574530.1 pyridoxine 5'-phosphate synthase [Caldimonas sp.]